MAIIYDDILTDPVSRAYKPILTTTIACTIYCSTTHGACYGIHAEYHNDQDSIMKYNHDSTYGKHADTAVLELGSAVPAKSSLISVSAQPPRVELSCLDIRADEAGSEVRERRHGGGGGGLRGGLGSRLSRGLRGDLGSGLGSGLRGSLGGGLGGGSLHGALLARGSLGGLGSTSLPAHLADATKFEQVERSGGHRGGGHGDRHLVKGAGGHKGRHRREGKEGSDRGSAPDGANTTTTMPAYIM